MSSSEFPKVVNNNDNCDEKKQHALSFVFQNLVSLEYFSFSRILSQWSNRYTYLIYEIYLTSRYKHNKCI